MLSTSLLIPASVVHPPEKNRIQVAAKTNQRHKKTLLTYLLVKTPKLTAFKFNNFLYQLLPVRTSMGSQFAVLLCEFKVVLKR